MILTITLNAAIDKTYTIANFNAGGNFRPSDMHALAGGKGLNVSRAAVALGCQVMATGFLGGYNGDFIAEGVRRMGVRPEFVRVEGESRICIAVIDPILGTTTEIWEKGPVIQPHECQALLDKIENLVPQVSVVTASGSLPQGVPSSIYADIASICRKLGKPFILDTSGQALLDGIAGRPLMIKPNIHELEAIAQKTLNTDEDVLAAAMNMFSKGIDIVAVSMGEKGSLVLAYGKAYRVVAPKVNALDAVGSGDAMVAGYAAALERRYSVEDMIRLGAAVATANVLQYGAGVVKPSDVQSFFEQIEIRCLVGDTQEGSIR